MAMRDCFLTNKNGNRITILRDIDFYNLRVNRLTEAKNYTYTLIANL